MGRKPLDSEADIKTFEKEILDRICSNCKTAAYQLHPQFPHKYLKCPQCAFTKEIKSEGFGMTVLKKD